MKSFFNLASPQALTRLISRPLDVFLDLSREPLDALVESLAGERVAGADVPRLVHDPLQAEGLRDLDRGHGLAGVHLVGEEQDRDLARADVGMLREVDKDIGLNTAFLLICVEGIRSTCDALYVAHSISPRHSTRQFITIFVASSVPYLNCAIFSANSVPSYSSLFSFVFFP